jgi:periplasmic divalent cation tolerance protein
MRMIEIWVNCPDHETARAISDALIAERRIACSNIFPEVRSRYHWKGDIQDESEIPLVVKTRVENFTMVDRGIRRLHPYETPGIIGVPVEFVNSDYLEWVYAETE